MRARAADKRGGDAERVALSAVDGWVPARSMEDLLALEEVLARLEQLEPRLAQVVELRFSPYPSPSFPSHVACPSA